MNEEDNRAKSRAVDSLLNFETVDTEAPQYLLFCWERTSNLGGEASPGVSVIETAAADW